MRKTNHDNNPKIFNFTKYFCPRYLAICRPLSPLARSTTGEARRVSWYSVVKVVLHMDSYNNFLFVLITYFLNIFVKKSKWSSTLISRWFPLSGSSASCQPRHGQFSPRWIFLVLSYSWHIFMRGFTFLNLLSRLNLLITCKNQRCKKKVKRVTPSVRFFSRWANLLALAFGGKFSHKLDHFWPN